MVGFRVYIEIMENQTENEMETTLSLGFRVLGFRIFAGGV